MRNLITRTMLNSKTRSHSALSLMGVVVLSLAASSVHAQRPSFGGLFLQVQDMIAGEEPFQKVAFGPTGQCRFEIDPTGALTGLLEYDPVGLRLMGNAPLGGIPTQGCRVIFGPTMNCLIEVQPQGTPGLLLRDPRGIRIWPPIPVPPNPPDPPILFFGETDDCQILVDPVVGGMMFKDPNGFRFINDRGIPAVDIIRGFIRFGELCTFGIEPELTGIAVKDPGGLRLLGQEGEGMILRFGPTDDCSIVVADSGIILTDPKGFNFVSPAGAGQARLTVGGVVAATEFVTTSSRRLKENIRPIDNALDAVKKLRGVRFDWRKEARKSGGTDLGFVAEEVAEVVSEAAVYDEDHKATGVKYANLVALAVEGIKAQQEQIDAQQKLIIQLQSEVAALRSGR